MATEVAAPATEPPATPAEAEHGGGSADAELPKAVVQRVVRSKLVQILESMHKTGGDKKAPNAQINKDALLAFQESGKVFINYLASTANDYAKEAKRVTISAEDVFKALEELDFKDFVQPLRQFLEAHKANAKEKTTKKRGRAVHQPPRSARHPRQQQLSLRQTRRRIQLLQALNRRLLSRVNQLRQNLQRMQKWLMQRTLMLDIGCIMRICMDFVQLGLGHDSTRLVDRA